MSENKINGQITDKEAVREIWGDEFAKLADNKRIVITENEIFVKLRGEVKLSDGSTTKLLKLREPNVRDLKNTDTVKGDISKSAVMIASISDVLDSSLDKLGASDFTLLNLVTAAFLGDGQETGAMS
jgi:hypothetical protein